MSKAGIHRLKKEYKALLKEQPENIEARPSETDLFKWHYVIKGPKGTPYAGGVYHGILQFPKSYPYKPPRITMRTPNGRFSTDTRLCLSMSDFHPESWNPLWKVSSILTGLLSFMLDEEMTSGSISLSTEQKRRFARHSLEFNLQDPVFRKLFPHYIQEAETRQQKQQQRQQQQRQQQRQEKLGKGKADPAAGTVDTEKSIPVVKSEHNSNHNGKNGNGKQQQKKTSTITTAAAAAAPGNGKASTSASRLSNLLRDESHIDRLIIFVMLILLGLLFRQLY